MYVIVRTFIAIGKIGDVTNGKSFNPWELHMVGPVSENGKSMAGYLP